MMLPLVDSPILSGPYWKPLLTQHSEIFQYCSGNLDSSGVSKPSSSISSHHSAEANGC